MSEFGRISERDLAAAWDEGRFLQVTTAEDGRELAVVHRGSWTHGFGPDFRDAMIVIGGRSLRTGSIELHLVTSGWRAHGHHLDPRYNDVVLHVVGRHDGAETRRADGALVPVVELGEDALAALPRRGAVDWSLVGGEVCAEAVTRSAPASIRRALWQLGDARLATKVARMEAQLSAIPPAEALYRELWDGLGYSANRAPMRLLSERLPLARLEQTIAVAGPTAALPTARGLLFGVAGFLPASPSDAAAARWAPTETAAAELAWAHHGSPWHDAALPATAWTRARVRPANHPARRLATGAALLAGAAARGGLLHLLMDGVRAGADCAALLRDLAAAGDAPALGADRAAGIAINAIVPFALALAEHTGDLALGEAAGRAWEALPPAEPNEVTRRALRQVAGDARLRNLGARGQQGLIHLDQALCRPRRCFECPIAWLATSSEPQASGLKGQPASDLAQAECPDTG